MSKEQEKVKLEVNHSYTKAIMALSVLCLIMSATAMIVNMSTEEKIQQINRDLNKTNINLHNLTKALESDVNNMGLVTNYLNQGQQICIRNNEVTGMCEYYVIGYEVK